MKMNLGRLQGIILFLIGALFAVFGYIMVMETDSVLQLFFTAPPLILLGIALIIFSGHNVPLSESRDRESQKEVFLKAPLLHKIIWISSFVIGLAITIYLIIITIEI